MSFALILQHAEPFGAGRIVPVLRDYGIPIELRRLWKGDSVDIDFDELRVLVILGAGLSQTVSDVQPAEVQLIQQAIAADRPTLASGFGARLLAHAAGAKVYPNAKPGAKPDDPPTPMPEIGWGPVMFPFPGGTEPMVFGLIDGTPMFHWHTDTCDLPKLPAPATPAPPPAPPPPTGNALLSSSHACRNQAFRFKNRLFGFQYHFELGNEEFEKIFASDREAITRVIGADGERKLRDGTARNYSRYVRSGDRILNNFVQYLKTY